MASRSRTTGTASRNTDPHQKFASITPPTTGPATAPPMNPPVNTATAAARCFGSWNMWLISAKPDGASVAAATPISARAVISIPALLEKAASTDADPNAAAPDRSSRRRPSRSPSVPIVIRNPAIMKP